METILEYNRERFIADNEVDLGEYIYDTFNEEVEECFIQAVDGVIQTFKIMGMPYSEALSLKAIDCHEYLQRFGKWYAREMAYTICELNEYGEAWIGDIKIMRRGNKD